MATPGIDAVEAQGAPPRAGLAEAPGGDELPSVPSVAAGNGAGGNGAAGARPRTVRWPVPVEAPHVPALDEDSLRLVAGRRLYDDGVLLGACASLAPLASPAAVRANPHDLARLGISTSSQVTVRSARGAVVLEVIADDGVPRGVASIDFNLRVDGRAGASALIDGRAPVVDVRLETS
jgi:anaerobic selenocysteine-containing dehydrogenase